MRPMPALLIALCSCSLTLPSVFAEDLATGNRDLSVQETGNEHQREQDFVNQAASGGLYEIRSSQMILRQLDQDANGSSTTANTTTTNGSPARNADAVRRLAEMMIDDHTRMAKDLEHLAENQNLAVPPALDAACQSKIDTLSSTSPSQRIDTYLAQQKEAHEKTIALFEDAAQHIRNAEMLNFINTYLPVLKKHLAHVESACQNKM